jgi:hypothetical protein
MVRVTFNYGRVTFNYGRVTFNYGGLPDAGPERWLEAR